MRGGPQPVVTSEVDDVCGDCLDEGWRETAPEGGDTLVPGDFDETFPGAFKASRGGGGLFNDAGMGKGGGEGGSDTGFRGVGCPEDFAAAGSDAEFWDAEEGRGGAEGD